MKLTYILAVGALSVAAVTGGLALAKEKHDNDKAEIQAFLSAGQTISDAIKGAEQATSGQTVKAEFEENDVTGLYEVETVSGRRLVSVEIDAGSGKVISTEDEGDLSKSDEDFVHPLTSLAHRSAIWWHRSSNRSKGVVC